MVLPGAWTQSRCTTITLCSRSSTVHIRLQDLNLELARDCFAFRGSFQYSNSAFLVLFCLEGINFLHRNSSSFLFYILALHRNSNTIMVQTAHAPILTLRSRLPTARERREGPPMQEELIASFSHHFRLAPIMHSSLHICIYLNLDSRVHSQPLSCTVLAYDKAPLNSTVNYP